jgi:hypothetical protein
MVAQGTQVRAKSLNESTIHRDASVHEITILGVQGSDRAHLKAVRSIETVNAKHGKQPGKDDSVYD